MARIMVIVGCLLGLSLNACIVETRGPRGGCRGERVPGHYGPYGGWHPGHWECR